MAAPVSAPADPALMWTQQASYVQGSAQGGQLVPVNFGGPVPFQGGFVFPGYGLPLSDMQQGMQGSSNRGRGRRRGGAGGQRGGGHHGFNAMLVTGHPMPFQGGEFLNAPVPSLDPVAFPAMQNSTACRHWVRGFCNRGEFCQYKHIGMPGGMAPNGSQSNRRCRHWARLGYCQQGDNCGFAHSGIPGEEIPRRPIDPDKKYLTIQCRHFERGHCHRGNECRFMHQRTAATELAANAYEAEQLANSVANISINSISPSTVDDSKEPQS